MKKKRMENIGSLAAVLVIVIVFAFFVSLSILVITGINLHTVSFNADGEIIYTVETQGKGAISLHEDPIKEGYTFEGWYFDKDTWEVVLSERYFSENKLKADVTVYAKWKINSYTVTFKSDDIILKTEKVDYGSPATAPENPTKEASTEFSYVFTAWDVPFNRVMEDLTVIAQFAITTNKFKVIFKDYDGTVLKTQQDIPYGNEAIPPANVITREGYAFVGWDNQFSVITSDLIVTAQYETNQYSIDFISNGGSEVETITQDFENEVSPPADPTREGYSFAGWYTDDGVFQNEYEFSKMPFNGIVLYANWIIKEYSLSLKKNREGAGQISESGEKEYNSSVTITAITNDASEYVWIGWFEGESIISEEESYVFNMPAANREYEARWVAKTYNIFYVMNYGTNNLENPTKYTVEDFVNLEDPEKENYSFSGWYLDEGFENEFTGIAVGTTGDITIYACWIPVIYRITYELYGGENNAENPLTYTIEKTVNLEDPRKDNYDFSGWYLDEEFENEFTGIAVGTTGDITVHAGWTPTIYTITYVLYGGDNNEGNPRTYTVESDDILFLDPTKEGYEFLNWYYIDDWYHYEWELEIMYVLLDEWDYDLTLHAKWKTVSYNITYNLDGGWAWGNPATYTIEDSFNLGDPEKDYYDFTGWYTDAELEEDFLGEVGNTGDLTLYAGWIPTIYTITYELHGGINNPGNIEKYTLESEWIYFLPPTKEGYEFEYWYYYPGSGGNIIFTEIDPIDPFDITIQAKWNLITTISFDSNGGSEVNSIAKGAGKSVEPPDEPTKEGYTFENWYADNGTFENVFVFNKMPESNVVVYANWTPNSYNVSLNKNIEYAGAVTGAGNKEYASSVTITANTNIGYTWLGWFDGDIKVSTGNELVYTFNMPASDRIYIAKWRASEMTFSFEANSGEGAMQSEIVATGESLPKNIFVKDDCFFNGWAVETNGVATYFDEQTILVTEDGSQMTLYATWLPTYQYIDSSGNVTEDGEYILFGMYPQTIKAEGITLGDIADSRGYYLGSDGCYYAQLTATPFTNDYKFSTGEDITDGVIYCFKVEPIKWRILSEEDGKAFILCESVIDKMAFLDWDLGESNNYKDSSIRAWLNDEFYNITFYTDPHKEIVQVTLVDNSPQSTGNDSNPYACDDTEDFIFLPSYSEMTNPDFGFSSYGLSGPGGIGLDIERRRLVNDYSLATGAWVSELEDVFGTGRWWLRSPADRYNYAFTVFNDGCLAAIGVFYYYLSVVPALTIKTERRWLHFDSNGGSDVSSIAKIAGEDITSLIVNPEKEGHEFGGWYKDNGTFENEYIFSTMPIESMTLYAKWIVIEYDITYNLNGGANHENNPAKYTIESTQIIFGDAIRTGYTFDGWYRDSGFATQVTGLTAGSTGDITVYAKWKINQYTYTFYDENGTTVLKTATVDYGSAIVAPNAPTKTDANGYTYTFSGWDKEIPATITDNITFTAAYSQTAINYTITYELEGGTNHTSNPSTYTVEDSIILQKPTQDCYNFVGWFSDESLSVAFTGITVGTTGNITVYAKWEQSHVYFGEYPQTEKESSVTITASKDSRGYYLGDDNSYYILLSDKYYKVEPILWKILKDDNGELFIHSTIVLEGKKFDVSSSVYASSEIRNWLIGDFYNIAFTAEEQARMQPYTSSDNLVQGDKVFLLSAADVIEESLGFANNASRMRKNTDYSIATGAENTSGNGWWWLRSPNTNNRAVSVYHGGAVGSDYVYHVYGGVVPALKIRLQGNVIVFDTNGGTYIEPIIVLDGNATQPLSPEKEGCNFDGWYLDDVSFENEYDFDATVTESFILYAKWDFVTYNITYELEGGTNHTSNPSTYTVETSSITFVSPTKTGYAFDGWYSDSGFTTQVTGITAGSTGDITVYAKWNPPEGHVYFGEYPQTEKESSVNITTTQDSRGYYLGSDGSYYALLSSNGKYYKVEPILWKMLQDNNGELFIHSTIILEGKRFDASENAYGSSEIRNWLVSDFMNKAFTEQEREKMQQYNSSDGLVSGDKVFLLSYSEATDANLGFPSDTFRIRQNTDYSIATGASNSSGNGSWWLRTPISDYVRYVSNYGIINYRQVNNTDYGIAPALKIKLS